METTIKFGRSRELKVVAQQPMVGVVSQGASTKASVPLILDSCARSERVRRLLMELPDAAISAVSPAGFFVPMPPAVPLNGQSVVQGHASALELVSAQSLASVIGAWQDAHEYGSSQVTVPSAADGDGSITIDYVDAQEEFGVFLCLLTGAGSTLVAPHGQTGAMRPRVSTVRKDQQAVFTQVDTAIVSILGHEDLIGRRNAELIHPDDAPRAIANWMDMLASPGESRRTRLRQAHRDGHWVWFEITNHNRLNDPSERCVVAEMVDISEEMAAHEFVRGQEELLRRLTDSLPVGVVQVAADGLIVHRNARITEMLGHTEAVRVDALFDAVLVPEDGLFDQALAASLAGGSCDLDLAIRAQDGAVLRCHLIFRSLAGQGVVICVDDVTEAAQLHDRLRDRATYDPLTGSHNRSSVLHQLDQALHTAGPDESGLAVLFIDLDGFKSINDAQGHDAGDALLVAVSDCLRQAVREHDMVGRIGGDEFLILGNRLRSPAEALSFAGRVATALRDTFQPLGDHEAVASIGIAWTAGGPGTAEGSALIRLADAAMYRSKKQGRGEPILATENLVDQAPPPDRRRTIGSTRPSEP